MRIDHQFSDKTTLMVHYIRDGVNQNYPTTLWATDTYPTVGTTLANMPQSYLLRLTRTVSPTLLNEFTVDFNRQPLTLAPTGTFTQPAGLALQPLFPGTNTDNRIPAINLSGPALGVAYNIGSWPWTNVLNTWIWRDQMTKTAGNHTLIFGGSWEHYLKEQELFGNTQGSYTFTGEATAGQYLGPNGQILTTPGNEFADFLLGNADNYSELQKQTMPAYLNNLYGLWAGDNWKVKDDFSLNLGLRWEGMPHAYEQYNNISAFRPSLYSAADTPQFAANGSLVPGTGSLLNGIGIAGQNGIPPGLVDNHWALLEPRIGLAWQPFHDGKTVIRGGYGLFYENIQGNDIYNVAPNPPFSNTPLIFNTNFTNPGLVRGTVFPGSVQAYDPQYLQPYSQQWSFGLERQFSPKVILSVMYVGSKGTDEQINSNINQPFAGVPIGAVNQARPFAGWGNIGWYQNSTSSNYNSLQASLRFSDWHGLTSGVSYTWSHCMDFSDGDVGGIIANSYNLASEFGNCGFNIPQMLVFNYVYTLPIARGTTGATRTLLSGWQVSGITTMYSGSPLTITAPGDPAQVGSFSRANVIGNPNNGPRTVAEWFNAGAFAAVPLGTFGNASRNSVFGTPLYNWDMSLFKNFTGIPFFKTAEGATVQFRAEVFNTFNTAEFNGFFTTFGTPGFGGASSTRDPREFQLGLKFMF